MNESEAQAVLIAELKMYRALTYAQIVKKIGTNARTYERRAESGVVYQLELQCFGTTEKAEMSEYWGRLTTVAGALIPRYAIVLF